MPKATKRTYVARFEAGLVVRTTASTYSFAWRVGGPAAHYAGAKTRVDTGFSASRAGAEKAMAACIKLWAYSGHTTELVECREVGPIEAKAYRAYAKAQRAAA